MKECTKSLLAALIGGLVVSLIFLFASPRSIPLGAQSNFSGPLNSAAGYQESGTEIINTNGAFIGTVSSTAVQRIDGEISLAGNNCAERSNVVIPAISGIGSTSGNSFNATSVTLSQTAVGDLAFASWNSSTGTLDALGLTLTAHASSGEVRVVFSNPSFATSSANNIGTLRVCSID